MSSTESLKAKMIVWIMAFGKLLKYSVFGSTDLSIRTALIARNTMNSAEMPMICNIF